MFAVQLQKLHVCVMLIPWLWLCWPGRTYHSMENDIIWKKGCCTRLPEAVQHPSPFIGDGHCISAGAGCFINLNSFSDHRNCNMMQCKTRKCVTLLFGRLQSWYNIINPVFIKLYHLEIRFILIHTLFFTCPNLPFTNSGKKYQESVIDTMLHAGSLMCCLWSAQGAAET